MRFSLNFVKEFLELHTSSEELSTLLTMSGMEVEQAIKIDKDVAFDIEVTSNRYDWLSILGITREIAVCLGKQLKIEYPALIKKPQSKTRKVNIENVQDCPFYVGRSIKNVTVSPSPAWLKERVVNCGINSINNIVDITNYCMLKWGNPLHAFDEDKLEGDIYIRRAKPQEEFIGIDGKQRILTKDNLVIADSKKVIALAGVMGAKNTEVTDATKNIFIEAAIFSPLTIRHSRRQACLDTESSYRFERRVYAEYLEYASQEAAKYIVDIAQGEFSGYVAAGKKISPIKKKIIISLSKLNNYLKAELSKTTVQKILSNLGFEIISKSDEKMVICPPAFRFDVDREVDIYEEIVRIYGFENISASLPQLPRGLKDYSTYEFKNDLRKQLSLLGLREIITFSIENKDEQERIKQENYINLVNPLRQQENTMRGGLLLGMIKAMVYNLNHDQDNLKFFEIANIYLRKKDSFQENSAVSLGLNGKENLFILKGVIIALLKRFGVQPVEFKETSLANFTNALIIYSNGEEIGFIGKLDNSAKEAFGLKDDLCFSQLSVSSLQSLYKEKKYQPFAIYPIIWRDLSIALAKNKKFTDVENIIKAKGNSIIDFKIIDTYQGKDLPTNYLAFTLRIFYQSPQRTLTAQEVDSYHNLIRQELANQEGIVLR